MLRLNQTQRNQIGKVYKPQINNNISKTTTTHYNHKTKEPTEMSGEGFTDIIKNIYEKGKQIADGYSGELGTNIRNAIPASDNTARNGFVGEKHGILELSNGKYGIANYMGPGTNLKERLIRGDPPRTEVDKASMAHDIRYALAKKPDDIRNADKIMMSTVDKIERTRGDSIKNITQARLIKAKMIGEDLGVIRKDAFSGDLSKKEINKDDETMLNNKLSNLSGYGMLPGDALKMKLLKQIAKNKMKGSGLSTSRDLRNSYSLSGSGGMIDFIINNIIPKLMKEVGIPNNLVNPSQLKNIITKSINMVKGSNIQSITEHLSKTILPLLIQLKNKSMGGSGMIGRGKMKVKLINSLSKGLQKSFKYYMNPKKNMKGGAKESFWSGFKRGFLSVFKPGSQILSTVATTVGAPEIGIPLGLLSNEL